MNHNSEIKYHSAVIFVKDIENSKKFYTEILGQAIDMDFGKNVILKGGMTLWEISPNHIIPEQLGRDSITDEASNRFELYFETEGIDGVFQALEENCAELLHPLHEEPWGQKTVRFFDPDRHLVEVGETLETFVSRLCESMTPEQVSEKTSIPLETVRELIKK
jgi:catechol 2,3-dioxygenase-like lactoylglutathione lyase family enzyme